jgi:undecaprenyl-phosphate 4-deoxy-4-formamido-L-arabinose transferase
VAPLAPKLVDALADRRVHGLILAYGRARVLGGLRALETDLLTAPAEDEPAPRPDLSVVITVLNEERAVDELYRRATATLDGLGRSYELIFVDDGSQDGTFAALQRIHAADPRVRAVRFRRNFGQHPAMHAGLTRARGQILVTMDGDLQNAPEDIPLLVAAVEAGADVASGRRSARRDSWGRTLPSRVVNGMLRRFTGVDISDFGCAFNAYRRSAVEPVLDAIGKQKFTKALVLSAGASVAEVDVSHAARRGPSRYGPLRLTRLALHVLAGFWPQPIQWIGLVLGTLCGLLAAVVGIWGLVYWITEADFPGLLFLAGLVLLVLGIQGFILALVGEYLGRIRREVEGWPLYVVDKEVG